MRGTRATALIGVFLFALNTVARADDPTSTTDADAEAERLRILGRHALAAEDYQKALEYFEESERLSPKPKTLGNVALAEKGLHRYAAALRDFKSVIQQLPSTDDMSVKAAELIAELYALPKLTITLIDGDGAKVTLDGVEVAAADLGKAQPVDPGHHLVVVSIAGRDDHTYPFDVADKENKLVEVEPTAPPPKKVVPAPTSSASSSTTPLQETRPQQPRTTSVPSRSSQDGSGRRTAAYVVGGVGALSLGVGIVAGVMVINRKSTISQECNSSTQLCSQTGLDAASSAKTFSIVADVGFGLGLTALGVAAYLLFTSHESQHPTTAIVPALGPGLGGVSLTRSF
jgi:hypothetical protein